MENSLRIKFNNLLKDKRLTAFLLNLLIFFFAVMGVVLSCIFAKRDGYSSWHKRFLYFTQLSNVWIALICLIFAITLLINVKKATFYTIFVLKYVFTVSITITGIIFCTLLAPFADFNVWTFSSILTHAVVPLLSIIDFFTCNYFEKLKLKHAFFSLIPPFIYFVFANILSLLNVDFGRGETYPYFFMNLKSEVGLFGFVGGWTPQIGTFYWLVFLLLFIFAVSFCYYKIHNKRLKNL